MNAALFNNHIVKFKSVAPEDSNARIKKTRWQIIQSFAIAVLFFLPDPFSRNLPQNGIPVAIMEGVFPSGFFRR
jgi:hypothetical protein